MNRLLVFLLLGACAGEPTQEAKSEATPQPSASPAPAATLPAPESTSRTEVFEAKVPEVWNAQTIARLPLAVPSREAKTPSPLIGDTTKYRKTAEKLEAFVRTHGLDRSNPWAVSHALTALGPELAYPDGEPAIDALFREYAEEFMAGGQAWVRFPRSRGNARVEPHTALMLKTFVEIGVSPERSVVVQGNPHTVGDLYRGTLLNSSLDAPRNHSTFVSTNDMPWALQALAGWAPLELGGGDLKWIAADGTPMSLKDFSVFNTSVIMAETQFLFQAMTAGANFEKKGQGIFKYTCGGAHLLQGVAYANARGLSTEIAMKGVAGQVALSFWRLPKELTLYDEAAKKHPQHADILLVQRLKYTGHFLETMHKMAALGLYTPDEKQQRMLAGAAEHLVLVVEALEQSGMLKNMDKVRAKDEQLYLDLIGDSAHAVRGLRLALGEGTVRY